MNRSLKSARLILLISLLFIFSCKKNESSSTTFEIPDFSTQVNASVSGFVTNENEEPVNAAQVNFGSFVTTTDKYGFFEIKNTKVVQNAAVVIITKPGYFKGIKTFITEEGKSSFCRIKLIPKTITGTINASSGGTVALSNGLKVTLPANGVVNTATNTAYAGTINVSSFWIDPTGENLHTLMPGDLWGLNKNRVIKVLQTYGMAAVELTSTSGELLQIAEGKKATLTTTIPASILADAPESIPLWYFDEAKGYWKEEGTAIKTGNTYVGEVGHFSFWNYDYPFSAIKFSCKVTDTAGNPLSYQTIVFSNPGLFCKEYFFTDSNGGATGWIAISTYQLAVKGDGLCDIYSRPVSLPNQLPYDGRTDPIYKFENIVIPPALVAHISGNVTDCANMPVTNGYLMLRGAVNYNRYVLNNTGVFSILTAFCNGDQTIHLTAENTDSLVQSNTSIFTITYGDNNVGTLKACNLSAHQFFNYTIDSNSYSFIYPNDWVGHDGSSIGAGNYSYLVNKRAWLTFDDYSQPLGVGNDLDLLSFIIEQPADTLMFNNPAIKLHITEYGTINEFIAGNFSGTAIGAPPDNNPHNITCNFRVRRSH